jgi:hypothetical protein
MPLAPQTSALAAHSLLGSVWSRIGPQTPLPVASCLSASAHASHVPPQAASQQNPSTHWPVAQSRHGESLQSDRASHAAPCGLRGAHVPFAAQKESFAQPASSVQELGHEEAVPLQRYGGAHPPGCPSGATLQ